MSAEQKPLRGKKILVTRPKEQALEFASMLENEGSTPILLPSTEIYPVEDSEEVSKALEEIENYDWIMFTSVNGVRYFLKAHFELLKNMKDKKKFKIAAVGEKTALEIKSQGFEVDFTPSTATGHQLAEEMGKVKDFNILIPRGDKGKKDIRTGLEQQGARVHDLRVYENQTLELPRDDVREVLEDEMDVLTFTSPFAVKVFEQRVKDSGQYPKNALISCIGPVTKKTLADHGYEVDILPGQHSLEGMIEAMKNHFDSSN